MEQEKKNDYFLYYVTIISCILITGFGLNLWKYFNQTARTFHYSVWVHSLFAVLWVVMAYVQYYFYSQRKMVAHKRLGQFGFLLGLSFIIFTIISLFHMMHDLPILYPSAIALIFIKKLIVGVGTDLFLFSTFFLLSMIFRKKYYYHRTFILFTILTFISSGISRIPIYPQFVYEYLDVFSAAAFYVQIIVGLIVFHQKKIIPKAHSPMLLSWKILFFVSLIRFGISKFVI